MRTASLALALTLVLATASSAVAGDGVRTSTSTVGEILGNPAAKAVVQKHLPGVVGNPQFSMARPLTLKALQRFAKGGISDAALAAIDEDFAGLAAKP